MFKQKLPSPKPLKRTKSLTLTSPLTHDFKLLSYLLLLRYGCDSDPDVNRPMLNIQSICKLTKLTPSTVRRLLKVALQRVKHDGPVEFPDRKKLKPYHLAYLLSPKTLNDWAHLSL
jgi:hypothetical protein